MTITIRDVAKHLGLSITTVSRALDDYDDVAEDTRKRVIEVAREMGYTPSRAARQLRRKQADTIGFVIPSSQPRFADPFFAEFIAGLGDETSSHSFDLLVSTAHPGDAEQTTYERLVQGRRVDGIVLTRMRLDDWRVRYLLAQRFPAVAFGSCHIQMELPSVEVDGLAGLQTLMAHLIGRGHRRIAYVGAPPELTLQTVRFAGYQRGLLKAGLPLDESLIATGDLTRAGGYQAAQSLLALANPPTAIIGANDLTAIGVLHAAHDRGLVVGKDLVVAGFDGIEDAAHTQPPLTTLNQPVYDIARRLAQMVITLIAGDTLAESCVQLQPELIIRASTAG